MRYWITIEVEADPDMSLWEAEAIVQSIPPDREPSLVDYQGAPPQGSCIVGDMREDEL